jgi:hypothetical protein
MEEIKMQNEITTNVSLCLLDDHSKTWCLLVIPNKVGIHYNKYKKKDGKGGEALRGWKFVHDLVWQEG